MAPLVLFKLIAEVNHQLLTLFVVVKGFRQGYLSPLLVVMQAALNLIDDKIEVHRDHALGKMG